MIVMEIIPTLDSGGAEAFCAGLTEELGKAKSVKMLYLVVLGPKRETKLYRKVSRNNCVMIFLNKKTHFDVVVLMKLCALIMKIRPDCVHTQLTAIYYSILPCFLWKVKVKVHTVQNVPSKECRPGFGWVNYFAFRALGWIPVGLSDFLTKEVAECYKCRAVCIPNGIPLVIVSQKKEEIKTAYARTIGFEVSSEVILSVGRLVPQKNHEALINAFGRIATKFDCCLLIVGGERNEYPHVKGNLIKQIDLLPQWVARKIYFLGERDDVHLIMQIATTLVLTSLFEGVPLVLLEAMMLKLPIIASNVGGVPDILSVDEAILINLSNSSEIDHGLRTILSDKNIAKKYADNAFEKFIANYKIEKIVNQYMTLFTGRADKLNTWG